MPGATGRFPDGMLDEHDEGELVIGMTVDQGNVIVNFGKPVAWVGLPPEQAEAFANMMLQKIAIIRGQKS